MTFPKFLTSVNRYIPVAQNRVYLERADDKFFLKTDILPGDFILKDGCFSASTVFAQERGIFIGKDNKFIELSSLSNNVYRQPEAFKLLQGNIADLPTEEDLRVLNDVALAINNSLIQIGLKQFKFSPASANSFWSQESVKDSSIVGKRRLLRLKKAEDVSSVSYDNRQISGLITERKTLYVGSDIIVVRTSSADTYWVLQGIANDCFYILSRLHTCPLKCKNDYGVVFYEGSQLVVENAVDNVYFNGNEKVISTVKEYFQRSPSGLYVKVGENYGHWPL